MSLKAKHPYIALICLPCILFSTYYTKAEDLRVRIFSTIKVERFSFTASFGTYTLNDSIAIKRSDKVIVSQQGDSINIKISNTINYTFDSAVFHSEDLKCFFLISPSNAKPRRYDKDLLVKPNAKNGGLLILNLPDEDSYISGVVQSEAGGASDNTEFFKVQAVCARTYMMRNISKHKSEDFNLCDDVNCQVYLDRATKEECIEGTRQTSGEIIVDSLSNPIEALFYSNSGGQTMAAKDVWGKDISYLQSIQDSFSIDQPSYKWEKEIEEKQWLNYFRSKGVDIKDYNNKVELKNFSQTEGRKSKIFDIPLVQVRKDFNLKSTFFDVTEWGGNVKLKGRGYGHGVGLSQEGAAQMCEEGYEYWEVIAHYYVGTKIVSKN